jgi:hypothetical protein
MNARAGAAPISPAPTAPTSAIPLPSAPRLLTPSSRVVAPLRAPSPSRDVPRARARRRPSARPRDVFRARRGVDGRAIVGDEFVRARAIARVDA